MLGLPIALIFMSIGSFRGGFIQNTYFLRIDFDSFAINVAFIRGNGEDQTYAYLHHFKKAVREVDEERMSIFYSFFFFCLLYFCK